MPQLAQLVEEQPDSAEIFHPQRDRRMLKQAAGVNLARRELAPRRLPLRHVFKGKEDAAPILFIAGQDAALQMHIDPAAGEGVVHSVALERRLPLPELHELLDVMLEHLVAKHAAEIVDQMPDVVGAEKAERLAIDLDDADQVRAHLDAGGIAEEVFAKRRDARLPPGVEELLHAAVVLKPQRHGREMEHLRIVAKIASQPIDRALIVVVTRLGLRHFGQSSRRDSRNLPRRG